MTKDEILKRLKEGLELLENDLEAADTPVKIGEVVLVHTFRSLQTLRDATRGIGGCYSYCTEASSQLTGVSHELKQKGGKS